MKFDQEEQELLDAYEKEQISLKKPTRKELESIKVAAVNTFKKDKRITLRLYEHDLDGIQKKAMELGIPYQTLISGIIHSYVEGDLVQKVG
jgi:predicted DNA binding CopG/RHH family protein